MHYKHLHYLRHERRNAGLTQAEVAALLGSPWKSKVARYERGQALPPLKIVLGYEAVMHKPIAELFTGLYEEVAIGVRARARTLLAKPVGVSAALAARRRQTLERILQ